MHASQHHGVVTTSQKQRPAKRVSPETGNKLHLSQPVGACCLPWFTTWKSKIRDCDMRFKQQFFVFVVVIIILFSFHVVLMVFQSKENARIHKNIKSILYLCWLSILEWLTCFERTLSSVFFPWFISNHMPLVYRCPVEISNQITHIDFNNIQTSSDNSNFKLVKVAENYLPRNIIQLLLWDRE